MRSANSNSVRAIGAQSGDGMVFVSFAESFSSPEVVWSLADAGFNPLVFGRAGSSTALRSSRYARIIDVLAPERDVSRSALEMQSAVQKLTTGVPGRHVFLALDDVSLLLATMVKWPENCEVIGLDGASVALNKQSQTEHAMNAGFRVPRTVVLTGPGGSSTGELDLPVILKPAEAVSVRNSRVTKDGFRICHTPEDLRKGIAAMDQSGPVLMQEYISGVGEGVFGIASSGSATHWSAHRRIRMMNPLGSGSSACMSVQPGKEEMEQTSRFLASIRWSGPFMIELLRDRQGRHWFMEFNGRIWGSTALSRRCGMEYPALAVANARGQAATNAPAQTMPVGVVCRHAGREILHALFVLRGRRPSRHENWPTKWKTIRELFRVRRSERWYNWREDDRKVFFKDVWCTLSAVFAKRRKEHAA